MAVFTPAPQTEELPAAARETSGNGHQPHRWRAVGRAARGRWWWAVVAAVVAAATLVGVEVTGSPTTYPVGAVFARAPGLFPGAAVEVLGVPVGTVTSVRNVDDEVKVGLAIDHGRAVPARATASLVAPLLLGEPSIELSPGYTGGPSLRAGTVIPESRTAVPVSTEQLLKSLEHTLRQISPHAVGSLITSLAQDLNGQGKNLSTLISGAAGTLKLLATKADDLGQLSGSLAQLTGTLDSRTSALTQLITDYDTVSGVIAQHSAQLGGAITQLSQASTQVVQLLVPNLSALESDVGTVTTVGRTLDRNLTNIDEVFSQATSLFAGAGRAYTPTYNWLTLNLQTPAGVTGAYIAGLVRDRLAGVCRRIAANHSSGLSAKELATLSTCGNPSSSFFDPIIDQVPTILNDVSSGTVPSPTASPAQMLQQGLATIPGVSSQSAQPSSPSSAPTTTAPTTMTTPTTSPPAGSAGSATCLGGLLAGATTCATSPGATSSGSSGSKPPSSGSTGGLGGLLSYHQAVESAPSLTAPSASELPPLPSGAPGARSAGGARRPASHRARGGRTRTKVARR